MKAAGTCYAVRYTYQQRAIVECSGTLSIPAEVYEKGDDAIHEYIRENESDANDVTSEVVDWHEEVFGTMEHEKA